MQDSPLSVVRGYHRAWTARRVAEAARLLAPDLAVEVPVNSYPTKESFVEALNGFGALVKRVELLAELEGDGEAMLLYDMDVELIGPMRVAEHFTVERGHITRVRQIHDTVAVRAAGMVKG